MAVGEHERGGQVLAVVAVGVEVSPGRVKPGSGRPATLAARPCPSPASRRTRHAEPGAGVVQALGLQVAADAAGLDVDDPAGLDPDGVDRRLGRGDRLVEADRCGQPPGQLGVADEVVLVQRLLEQQEPEAVQAGQVAGVGQGVGAGRP